MCDRETKEYRVFYISISLYLYISRSRRPISGTSTRSWSRISRGCIPKPRGSTGAETLSGAARKLATRNCPSGPIWTTTRTTRPGIVYCIVQYIVLFCILHCTVLSGFWRMQCSGDSFKISPADYSLYLDPVERERSLMISWKTYTDAKEKCLKWLQDYQDHFSV